MPSCAVCAASDSTPSRFLLTCSSCAASYHHRCHSPVLTDTLLIALVKASTDAARRSAPPDDNTPTLQNWKCAACTRPALVDLTVSDSDDEDTQVEDKVSVVEQDVKRERVKAEELPGTLPPRKYNIASTWIHKQHADSQTADAWDRLAMKNRTRRPLKVAAATPAARRPFVYVAALWLESRRSTLPVSCVTNESK